MLVNRQPTGHWWFTAHLARFRLLRLAVGAKAYEAFVKKGCPGTLVNYVDKQPAIGKGLKKIRSRGSIGDFQRSGSGVDVTLIKTYAKGMVRESPSFTDLMGIPEAVK